MAYSKDPSFIRGLLVTFLILLASVPVVILPLVGPILAFTMVPYLSGALGARLAHPKERVPLVLTCSLIWAVIETGVMLIGLSVITRSTPMGLVLDTTGLWIIGMIWFLNIIFMLLGAFHPWRDPFAELK
jgi:hypothetical protein